MKKLVPDKEGGLNSGFMIAQYAAALVSENKTLAHPASVNSIPASANKEDDASAGAFPARKRREIPKPSRHALAVELMRSPGTRPARQPETLSWKKSAARYYETRRETPILK